VESDICGHCVSVRNLTLQSGGGDNRDFCGDPDEVLVMATLVKPVKLWSVDLGNLTPQTVDDDEATPGTVGISTASQQLLCIRRYLSLYPRRLTQVFIP
jgi:hypothetical protein